VIQTPVSKGDIKVPNNDRKINNWEMEVIMFFLNSVSQTFPFFNSMKLLMLWVYRCQYLFRVPFHTFEIVDNWSYRPYKINSPVTNGLSEPKHVKQVWPRTLFFELPLFSIGWDYSVIVDLCSTIFIHRLIF